MYCHVLNKDYQIAGCISPKCCRKLHNFWRLNRNCLATKCTEQSQKLTRVKIALVYTRLGIPVGTHWDMILAGNKLRLKALNKSKDVFGLKYFNILELWRFFRSFKTRWRHSSISTSLILIFLQGRGFVSCFV